MKAMSFGALCLAGLVGISGFAAGARAATITEQFTFTGLAGAAAGQLVFTQGDLTLTIDAFHYADVTVGNNATITGSAASDPAIWIGINSVNGIGVCEKQRNGDGCTGGDQLDGGSNSSTDNEMLRFTFSGLGAPVTLKSIEWNQNDDNDLVDFFLGAALTLDRQFNAVHPPNRIDLLSDGPLTVFGIGLQDKSDELRISALTVTYEKPDDPPIVPLPAAGLLLLGAVGGLAAFRRRKAA